jgi:hypothetical protein
VARLYVLYLADDDVFRANYIEAWREQEQSKNPNCGSLILFIRENTISVPIPIETEPGQPVLLDTVLLPQLIMIFRLLRMKRGLSELIIPRILRRIDCVQVRTIFIALENGY